MYVWLIKQPSWYVIVRYEGGGEIPFVWMDDKLGWLEMFGV